MAKTFEFLGFVFHLADPRQLGLEAYGGSELTAESALQARWRGELVLAEDGRGRPTIASARGWPGIGAFRPGTVVTRPGACNPWKEGEPVLELGKVTAVLVGACLHDASWHLFAWSVPYSWVVEKGVEPLVPVRFTAEIADRDDESSLLLLKSSKGALLEPLESSVSLWLEQVGAKFGLELNEAAFLEVPSTPGSPVAPRWQEQLASWVRSLRIVRVQMAQAWSSGGEAFISFRLAKLPSRTFTARLDPVVPVPRELRGVRESELPALAMVTARPSEVVNEWALLAVKPLATSSGLPQSMPVVQVKMKRSPLPVLVVLLVAGLLGYLTVFLAKVEVEVAVVSEERYGSALGSLLNGLIFVAQAAVVSFVVIYLVKKKGEAAFRWIMGGAFFFLGAVISDFFGEVVLYLLGAPVPLFWAWFFGSFGLSGLLVFQLVNQRSDKCGLELERAAFLDDHHRVEELTALRSRLLRKKNGAIVVLSFLVGAFLGITMPTWTTMVMLVMIAAWDVLSVRKGPIKTMMESFGVLDDPKVVRRSVAAREGVPPATLAKLAGDSDREVRQLVAQNPTTPPAVLEQLAAQGEPDVLLALAGNPASPAGVLRVVAERGPPEFLLSLARNPSSPASILKRLALGGVPSLARVVAGNPNCPTKVLETLATRKDLETRVSVASNAFTPEETLRSLANDPDLAVKRAVALNPAADVHTRARLARELNGELPLALISDPNFPPVDAIAIAELGGGGALEVLAGREDASDFPPTVLERLCSASSSIKARLAANPAAPAPVLEELSGDQDPRVRAEVASNPAAPPAVLTHLAEDGDVSVSCNVAANPNVPPGALAKLSRQRDVGVRIRVGKNPNSGATTLKALARDESVRVRTAVAARRPLDPSLAETLAHDPDATVRSCVASWLGTPPRALEHLARDPSHSVALQVALNPSTPAEALETLASSSESVDVRRAVASHPLAGPRLLDVLANDHSWVVRQAVASNPSTPRASLERLARDADPRVRTTARMKVADLRPVKRGGLPDDLFWDSPLQIGIGDLVFYSVLTSHALVRTGSLLVVAIVAALVLVGLYLTLRALRNNKVLPGLPLSIVFGVAGFVVMQ
ncbi:MAG: hypothetical protein Kow0069_21860 [Promethearchaeota archaeon]